MKYKQFFLFILLLIFLCVLIAPVTSEDRATPTDINPNPSSLFVTKKLVGEIWHIRCDYMDGETFHAGGGIWKRDVIKNPDGILSKEGHRSNKCGDAEHWVIWVGADGIPYRMDEIKSGATGGTLPTIIYQPRYELSSEEIYAMQPSDTDLVWKYSQNFIDLMPWTDIQIGQRLYWTTQNGNQVWYHTGIPYKSTPTFMLFVDGVGYPLIAGESVEISDLMPGIHEIAEEADPTYYLGEITSTSEITEQNEWTASIVINEGEDAYVDWPNVVITPPPGNSPNPPPAPDVSTNPPKETETPVPEDTETLIPDETDTPAPDDTETPLPEETEDPTPTQDETEDPTPEETEKLTPSPTPEETEAPEEETPAPDEETPTPVPEEETPSPIPEDTETPAPEITESPSSPPDKTEEPSEAPAETDTPAPATEETDTPSHEPDETPVVTDAPTDMPEPTNTLAPTQRPTDTPEPVTPKPTSLPTKAPTKAQEPTIEPTNEPTVPPTEEPTDTPATTEEPTQEPTNTPKPKVTPTVTPEPTEEPIHIPEIPANLPQPKTPKPPYFRIFVFDEYATALGLELTINHVGDCFD